MKTTFPPKRLVAAEVTRRTRESIHQPPPHVGGYVLTLLAATALFTHAAFAAGGPKPPPPQPQPPSSGTLVLDYAGPTVNGAANWGLVVAPSGGLYAVGSELPGGDYWNSKQSVLASSDSGNFWSVLDEFAPPGLYVDFNYGLGGGVTSDSAGNLYVSSFTYDSVSSDRAGWYVRRSTDAGATWTTVADFAVAPVWSSADDVAIAADAQGDVYLAGTDYYSGPLWTVRKGIGGASFSTVDALPNSYPKDIFVHPTSGIFVVGQTQAKVNLAWLVRRSIDGGATWSNVDTYKLSNAYASVAMGVTANTSGIYVVGWGYAANSSHWIVRRSTDGGSSWTTVDDYQLIADNSNQARCIAKDASGNLFVAGSGNGKWILRKSVGGTGPWTTVDVFQNGGSSTGPNAIAADVFGNVFVGGNNGGNWFIKRY